MVHELMYVKGKEAGTFLTKFSQSVSMFRNNFTVKILSYVMSKNLSFQYCMFLILHVSDRKFLTLRVCSL